MYFNVDDLVKRIDAKIAELEEEERKEKLNKQKENKETESIKPIEVLDKPSEKPETIIPPKESVVENKVVENIPSIPIIENKPVEKEVNDTTVSTKEEVKLDIPQQKIEKNVEKIEPVDRNFITDDQFFDDFFYDD